MRTTWDVMLSTKDGDAYQFNAGTKRAALSIAGKIAREIKERIEKYWEIVEIKHLELDQRGESLGWLELPQEVTK